MASRLAGSLRDAAIGVPPTTAAAVDDVVGNHMSPNSGVRDTLSLLPKPSPSDNVRLLGMSDLASILYGLGLERDHVSALRRWDRIRIIEGRDDDSDDKADPRTLDDYSTSEEEESDYDDDEDDCSSLSTSSDVDYQYQFADTSSTSRAPCHADRRNKFFMFTRMLSKYLERADPIMHERCQEVLARWEQSNNSSDDNASRNDRNLTSLQRELRRCVGSVYWKNSAHYLALFENTSGPHRPPKFREAQTTLERNSNDPTSLQGLLPPFPDAPVPSWRAVLDRIASTPWEVEEYRVQGTARGQILHVLLRREEGDVPLSVFEAILHTFPGATYAESHVQGSALQYACRTLKRSPRLVSMLLCSHARASSDGWSEENSLKGIYHPDFSLEHVQILLRQEGAVAKIAVRDKLGDSPLDDILTTFGVRESPLWKSYRNWDKLFLLLKAVDLGTINDEELFRPLYCLEEGNDISFPTARFLPLHALIRHVNRVGYVGSGVLSILVQMRPEHPTFFTEHDDDGLPALHALLSGPCPAAGLPTPSSTQERYGRYCPHHRARAREMVRLILGGDRLAAAGSEDTTFVAANEGLSELGGQRLPLHLAIVNGWPHDDILNHHPKALAARDSATGLFPFQLAAATDRGAPGGGVRDDENADANGVSSSLDLVFSLLRKDPTLVVPYQHNCEPATITASVHRSYYPSTFKRMGSFEKEEPSTGKKGKQL